MCILGSVPVPPRHRPPSELWPPGPASPGWKAQGCSLGASAAVQVGHRAKIPTAFPRALPVSQVPPPCWNSCMWAASRPCSLRHSGLQCPVGSKSAPHTLLLASQVSRALPVLTKETNTQLTGPHGDFLSSPTSVRVSVCPLLLPWPSFTLVKAFFTTFGKCQTLFFSLKENFSSEL